ncbi:MAG: hypothetical protein CM15mP32_1840 [Flavobacteriaceae bacterium]|nr:MAG: hypothetical protein CM15mP32_1840 [Flavobacteriaceae bacterium]
MPDIIFFYSRSGRAKTEIFAGEVGNEPASVVKELLKMPLTGATSNKLLLKLKKENFIGEKGGQKQMSTFFRAFEPQKQEREKTFSRFRAKGGLGEGVYRLGFASTYATKKKKERLK